MVWQKVIKAVEPEKYFAFQWSVGDTSAGMYSQEEDQTLVEFLLESTDEGTVLTIRESGFDHLPEALREQAYPLNCEGWDAQQKILKTISTSKFKRIAAPCRHISSVVYSIA